MLVPAVLVRVALVLAGLALGGAANAENAPQPDLIMGVVPQRSASVLAVEWAPFMEYLSAQTGRKIRFESAPDIPTFDRRTSAGEFDLVYMSPMFYTVVHESVGYQVFAKEKDMLLKALIVVQKNSPYQKLEDLSGQWVDFPGPIAFAATLLPLAEFKKIGVRVFPAFAGSHEGVYNDVARGLYIAGGGVEKTLGQVDSNVRDQLRILWTSDTYTPHPFAAHPRVDRETVAKIQKAMLEMAQDARGKSMLRDLRFKGFVEASDSEYEKIKALADQR